MREYLPCDDSLPPLWSVSVVKGGDLIVDAPVLSEASGDDEICDRLGRLQTIGDVVQSGSSPRCRCWRVEGKADGVKHVLHELRLDLPESLATSQLGRLRELMLREARLHDSLDHESIVHLECGWLEQRTNDAPSWPRNSFPLNHRGQAAGALRQMDAVERKDGDHGETAIDARCRQQKENTGGSINEGPRSYDASSSTSSPSVLQPRHCACTHVSRFGDPVAMLRSCVPWTVGEEDSDDEGEEGMATMSDRRNSPEGIDGQEPPRWGGDHSTHWIGAAEPKTPPLTQALGAVSTDMGQRTLNASSRSAEFSIGDTREELERVGGWVNEDGSSSERQGQSMVCMAAYLLLPDGLTLVEWLDQEFQPRIALDDRGRSVEISAAEDWLAVWRQLSDMFLQMVRGVEYLHMQGVVHNSISTESVWVASDGRCRVGNIAQATPPGRRRRPIDDGPLSHFSSLERRRGGRVDSHSDVYSLGVLLLELWCRYLNARGLGKFSVTASDGPSAMLDIVRRGSEELAQPEIVRGLLNVDLVRRMLADDPFDRPDCFEVVDGLL